MTWNENSNRWKHVSKRRLQHGSSSGKRKDISVSNHLINNKVDLMHVYSTLCPNNKDCLLFKCSEHGSFWKTDVYSFCGLSKLTLWVRGAPSPHKVTLSPRALCKFLPGTCILAWFGSVLLYVLVTYFQIGGLILSFKAKKFFRVSKAKPLIAKQEGRGFAVWALVTTMKSLSAL